MNRELSIEFNESTVDDPLAAAVLETLGIDPSTVLLGAVLHVAYIAGHWRARFECEHLIDAETTDVLLGHLRASGIYFTDRVS